MNPTVSQLLGQGLIITALGMGLVFAALALLWGLLRLIATVFADKAEPTPDKTAVVAEELATTDPTIGLTDERARVAAIMAAALGANALPGRAELVSGHGFEYGRVAPAWLSANRSEAPRTLRPPVVLESK